MVAEFEGGHIHCVGPCTRLPEQWGEVFEGWPNVNACKFVKLKIRAALSSKGTRFSLLSPDFPAFWQHNGFDLWFG